MNNFEKKRRYGAFKSIPDDGAPDPSLALTIFCERHGVGDHDQLNISEIAERYNLSKKDVKKIVGMCM